MAPAGAGERVVGRFEPSGDGDPGAAGRGEVLDGHRQSTGDALGIDLGVPPSADTPTSATAHAQPPDLSDAELLMQESVLQDNIIRTPNQVEAVLSTMEKRAGQYKNRA